MFRKEFQEVGSVRHQEYISKQHQEDSLYAGFLKIALYA